MITPHCQPNFSSHFITVIYDTSFYLYIPPFLGIFLLANKGSDMGLDISPDFISVTVFSPYTLHCSTSHMHICNPCNYEKPVFIWVFRMYMHYKGIALEIALLMKHLSCSGRINATFEKTPLFAKSKQMMKKWNAVNWWKLP